jgi:lysophospholipase L1-like esterase
VDTGVTKRTVIEILVVALVGGGFALGAQFLPAVPKVIVGNRTWTVAWAGPPENAAAGGPQVTSAFPDGRAHGQTLRQVVSLSLGGDAFRVRFTNQYGDVPLELSHLTVAPALGSGAIDKSQMHTLEFNGAPVAFIPVGAESTSDPVPMSVPAGDHLAISISVFGTSPSPTLHQFAGMTSWISAVGSGDLTRVADGSRFPIRTTADFWLATVEVLNPPGAVHAVVALGDSLTDAYFLTDNDQTWPEIVQGRLASDPATSNLGMINGGIVANTVTDVGCTDCGDPMTDRVVRDVVDLPGVDCAVVFGGTNDIGRGASAAAVVHGLATILGVLHAHHMCAIGVTIPPRDEGSYGWVERTMDPVRRAVNGWLRGTHSFDALVDADQILTDPAQADRIAPQYSADGTHLNDAGRAALAAAVPLAALAGSTSKP